MSVPYLLADPYWMGNTSEDAVTMAVTFAPNDSDAFTGTIPHDPRSGPNMGLIRLISEVGLSLPIAMLGIIGNVLAFVVLCQQKQRLTTNVLLQALAIADTLILISSILLRSMRYVHWGAFNQIHHYIFVVLYPCVYFFRLADTWLTVMMTVDRYIAVCHPLKAQRVCTLRRTYITIATIIFLTLFFSLPRFFEYRLTDTKFKQTGFFNTNFMSNRAYTIAYRIILFFLVMYLIPMTLLIVLNIRLLYTLRKAYAHRSSMISVGSMHNGKGAAKFNGQKASRGVTIIVITVVIVCVACNTFAITSHIIWSLQMCFSHLIHLEVQRRYLANVSNILVTFNCAINFVVYCMFSRKFRAGLKQTCKCECLMRLTRRWRSDRQTDTTGTGHTSNTSVGLLPLKSIMYHKQPIFHKTSADL